MAVGARPGLAARVQEESQRFTERRELLSDFRRKPRAIECRERLVARKLRLLLKARDAFASSLFDLELGEVMQVTLKGPAFPLGLLRDLYCPELGADRRTGTG